MVPTRGRGGVRYTACSPVLGVFISRSDTACKIYVTLHPLLMGQLQSHMQRRKGSTLAGVQEGSAAKLLIAARLREVTKLCNVVMQQPAYPQQSGEDTEVCSETLQVNTQLVLSGVHEPRNALYGIQVGKI